MANTETPAADTPLARYRAMGTAALSDTELLAFMLPNVPHAARGQIARDKLTEHGGLRALYDARAFPAFDAAIELARRLLADQMQTLDCLQSPAAVRDYLRLTLAGKEHECFYVVFLDAQNRALACQELFRGTLTQTSVYPREVVKAALRANAAAVIFAHNHPSGVAEPSHADELLTQNLKQALAMVDVKVLDHFIVAGAGAMSFAERGLI